MCCVIAFHAAPDSLSLRDFFLPTVLKKQTLADVAHVTTPENGIATPESGVRIVSKIRNHSVKHSRESVLYEALSMRHKYLHEEDQVTKWK